MSQREIGSATGLNQATVSRSTSDANASDDDLEPPPLPPRENAFSATDLVRVDSRRSAMKHDDRLGSARDSAARVA